ncbi:MAG: 2-amino-4-hydroxy-6-hydroxymethyldihydropteridine diphosphokinase [Candidatus Improbicoccus devescovinae]|nr:MAG: 2-amino-4-hydroxy-6-hydroxymethyldihydropteridine diphosphokinase [Candidatus Improbicoccus devescovinae]
MQAILGLGSNLGDKLENLKSAIDMISNLINTELEKVSNFYETEPFEVPNAQDRYINCCVKIKTTLSPHVLLGACFGIESALGRTRPFTHASRIIDIDLLLYENTSCTSKELTLPHPGIKFRDFVMIPLRDICPDNKFGNFDFSTEINNLDSVYPKFGILKSGSITFK